MKEEKLSRRDFLKAATAGMLTVGGVLGLGGLLKYLSYQGEQEVQTDFDLGRATDFPLGSRTLRVEVPAMVLHTQEGFKALSLVCPHLGCTVESQSDGFACPCHGSRFDLQGGFVRGPAGKGLTPLRVEVTAVGHLHVYKV